MSLYGNCNNVMFASAKIKKKHYYFMFPIGQTVMHLQIMHFPCAGISMAVYFKRKSKAMQRE